MKWDDAFGEGDLDESEFPEPDADESDDAETVPCPYCGQAVYEEAERCPHCDHYISREDAPARPARWFVLGVFVCLAIVITWILWRL